MSKEIKIKFFPKAFQEVLVGMRGVVDSAASGIAGRANAMMQGNGGGFGVETNVEQRFGDPMYGVARPVARVVATDDATSAEEAEDKILTRAVTG